MMSIVDVIRRVETLFSTKRSELQASNKFSRWVHLLRNESVKETVRRIKHSCSVGKFSNRSRNACALRTIECYYTLYEYTV